jgi:hypothetical protein
MHEAMTIDRGFHVRAKARGCKQVNRWKAAPLWAKRGYRVSRDSWHLPFGLIDSFGTAW